MLYVHVLRTASFVAKNGPPWTCKSHSCPLSEVGYSQCLVFTDLIHLRNDSGKIVFTCRHIYTVFTCRHLYIYCIVRERERDVLCCAVCLAGIGYLPIHVSPHACAYFFNTFASHPRGQLVKTQKKMIVQRNQLWTRNAMASNIAMRMHTNA